MRKKFSIIIPVLNEGNTIQHVVNHLMSIIDSEKDEIIVVDGDPKGSTVNYLPHLPVLTCITTEKGRGHQMNAGAGNSGGDVLIFLHADTLLPEDGLECIDLALEDGQAVGGAFDLGFDDPHWWFAIVAASGSLRSRLTRIPFGDQGHFFRRDYFFSTGGYPEIPLMEDVEIMRSVKRRGDLIRILDSRVRTSARMWYKNGFIMNTLKNYAIQLMYLAGMPVEDLARLYYREKGKS